VVEKFVFQLEAQLGDRNITIELTPEANQWLAERGYDDKFGARPLGRVIQEHIKKPLAEEILFGALKDGGIVRVLVNEKDGEKVLGFEYIKADAPIRPRGPDELEDEDLDPDDGGPEGPRGGGVKSAPKPKAKRTPRRPGPRRPGARRGLSSSPVPKVPLGSR
jgi:ATP-dependent Clp protease ATP-binding subunit ClpA